MKNFDPEYTDRIVAAKIVGRCSSKDKELNGDNLDEIIMALLVRLNLTKSAEAFDNVSCWRG